ncbi:hypothetical protein Q1695_012668 [Nippostrongylus brasiliensis]|nr:hypothetical protein Q1695_012668 [Nippostrongylus brasiliensis]
MHVLICPWNSVSREFFLPLDIIVDEEKASENKKSPSEVNDEEKDEKEVDKKEGSKNSSGKSTPRALRTASAKELSTPPSGKLTRISSAKSVKKAPRQAETPKAAASRSVSALDSILGDGNKDTTEQHLSHFYDVNCSICLAKQKSQAEAEKREREEKEKQRLEDKRFREMLPAESFTPYPSREPITIEDADYRRGSQGFDEMRRIPSPESTGAACASDEEYAGSYDGGGGSPGFPDRDTEPHDWIPAQEPPISGNWRSTIPVDPLITNSGLWSGQIFMNNSSMATSLYLISNPVAYKLVPTLPPVLRIKGRIVPVIVFDYVHETVKHGEHHVAVLRLTRPTDMEGEQRYISIYEDMRRKGRYFAVDVPPDSFFKDIYLLPLGPGEEPPAILLPFDGPGLPARHPAIILCVIVMYKRSRSRKLEPGKSYSRESLVDRSPRDAHFQIGPRVDKLSRSHSPNSVHGSATSDHENIGPSSALAENNDESAFPSTADQDDRDVKTGFPPQPNNPAAALPDSTSTAENVKQEAEEPSSQGEAGPSTPPDPPPIDYAPVGEADNLLPSQFFTMAKKAAEAKEPVKVQSVDEIDTLPDLLVYIQLNSNPREIKEVVARFMMNPSLTDVDRELIRKKVMEKISAEKKKKAQSKKEPGAEEPTRSEAKKEPNTSLDRSPDTSGAIDFEALNNLSSFVGAGAQDLLKQAGERMEPLETRLPSSPPPPPPALPEDDDEGPSSASFVKVTEMKSSDLKVSEILPGPPPVPPVYGDDSSGGESPPERENTKGNDSSLHSRSSQQFHTMNIIPVPPPPSVMSGQLDIAVPPPPPPPPPLIPNTTSAKQPFTPPPPPPPIFASSTNSSQSKSTPPLPVPPPVFRPPVVPYPGLPPPPPFVNLPPPLPGMIPPPPPPKRVFSAGPSGNAPPGKPSTFGSVPELPPGSYMGSLAPLPSQLANASNPPKKPLPTGIIPSLGRALTERDLVPRTPTPPPSPKSQHNNNTSRSATKNGPRTPSPDMSKKRERELEIERLKKDIEEQQRRSAVMQAKIELAELEFQRKRGLVKTEQPSIKDNGGAVPEKPSATQAQEPSSSQAKHADNDAMDIDGGESESEHVEAGDSGKPSDAEAPLAAQWNEWGTSIRGRGVGMRGQPFGMPTGRPPLPPPGFRGRCALPRTPRGAPGRGGGFISPPEGSGYVAGQGGFFTPPPPSRGVRGAPNLRRGFPAAGRGGAFPMIPPPPLFGRGAGPHGPFRGSPRGIPPPPFGPPRGLPPMRGRFGPPPM